MADLLLDAKGLRCPMPVVRARKAIDTLQAGQVLEVIATDPGSMADFRSWTKNTGHEMLSAAELDGVYRYVIRKKA